MRFFGGQPVDMGNAGALQAQTPLNTTPLAPVWGGGPMVPGSVPGREGFLGPAPASKYKMAAGNNPLTDPRFQIPGGQPWNKTPILPGKETKEFEKQQFYIPPQLPSAGTMGNMGNVAGLANAQFYGGPQIGQVPPPGFQGKSVY